MISNQRTHTMVSSPETQTAVAHTECYQYNLAVQFNNIGAVLIEVKHFDLAKDSLSYAIASMKCFVNQKSGKQVEKNDSFDFNAKKKLSILQEKIDNEFQKSNNKNNSPCDGFKGAGLVLPYERPVRITTYCGSEESFDEDEIRKRRDLFQCVDETAAILYNTGLAYHLHSDGKKECLSRAFNFYSLSSRIIESACNSSSSAVYIDTSYATLSMAILNNMGQIYYEAGDISTARSYFDVVLKIYSMPAAHHTTSMDTSDVFFLNVMFLDVSPSAASAA